MPSPSLKVLMVPPDILRVQLTPFNVADALAVQALLVKV
jgi:hypothetical protein